MREELANARIKAFGSPKASDESILEIPAADLQGLLSEMVRTYNAIAEMVRDAGILRGRELARLTEHNNKALMAEKSPITQMLLLNAYARQHLNRIRDAMKAKRGGGTAGKIIQVVSKVEARAIKIIDYIKEKTVEGQKEIAIDSKEARTLFLAGGDHVSRKECIRSMKRAEKLLPALECNHRPNDPRQTMRLTGLVKDLDGCNLWQQSGLTG